MKNKCLCGAKIENATLTTDTVRFGNKANVLKCNNCSLVYIDQNSFSFPDDFYETQYHQTYITHIEPDALEPEKFFNKMLKATKIWSDRMKNLLTGNETVLDVGCSTGHFIKNIKSKAKKVYGHELAKKEVQFCKDVLGLDVDNKLLKDRFEEKTFDYITLIFVLEHIADPITFLNDLKKYLKPDGKFIILVPNANDALLRLYDIPLFRQFYYCIEHLYYYTPETITLVFDKVGLSGKIESLQEYPITNHLNWGYRQKPSDTLASRRNIPDIPLSNKDEEEDWEHLWRSFNDLYKKFLIEKGYSDRIWCEVGPSR